MSSSTTVAVPNTRVDAVLRIVEDVLVVAGTGVGAWLSTHNAVDTATVVAAAPVVRSAVASVLSKGRVSGVILAIKLVWQALGAQDALAASATLPAAPGGDPTA